MSVDFSRVGLAVGHATDAAGGTGLTVVRGIDGPRRGGVALVGRATGGRELGSLSPESLADRVDAVLLTGGSAYGLDAAGGVMRWMEERRRGFPIAGHVVPIVPAAVIFDLRMDESGRRRPTAEMAYRASEEATTSSVAEGSVGVGTGATVGKAGGFARAMKGGFGCAARSGEGAHVAAVVVTNAFGDVRSESGEIIAGARANEGGFLDARRILAQTPSRLMPAASDAARNTTLAVVATSVLLDRSQLAQLARAASAALYRRITPVGTPFDGDIVFALGPYEGATAPLVQVEALAVDALEEAIERSVRMAVGTRELPGLAGVA